MGGVFINYRVVDNPLGAAGIHEGLSTRFGKDNVFRDCVSLEAGEEYPKAIREALARSDVLVAVIGPQWLKLRDPAGTRLLDRPHDWVRRELLLARERGIAILPVLLRDTPEHALHPTFDELPPDISWLAILQAFPFSQLTYTTDLDRLAARVKSLAPGLAADGSRPLSISADLVSALEVVPCMENEHTRSLVLRLLRPTISGAVPYSPQRRAHVMNILKTCRNYDGGIAELVDVIRDFDGDTIPFNNFLKVLADSEA